jgi:hypothetical protein
MRWLVRIGVAQIAAGSGLLLGGVSASMTWRARSIEGVAVGRAAPIVPNGTSETGNGSLERWGETRSLGQPICMHVCPGATSQPV